MKNHLTYKIIGASINVHNEFGGPGLLESIYESALYHELKLQGFNVQRQVPIQVKYRGIVIREPLVIDMIVENQVIIEIKATEKNIPIYKQQLLTYLKMTGHQLGLLINFGYGKIGDGVVRVINGVIE